MSSVKEVAQRADVSVATVSRVLNNDPTVKTLNRNKVLKAIEELNYKPNMLAKSLRKKASFTIVLVMSSMSNPFYAGIVKGANEAVRNSGYKVIIGTTDANEREWETYETMLSTSQADGIVIISSCANKKIVSQLNDRYPVVMCNEYFDGLNLTYVSIDNKKAGYDAAKELLSRGCRHIVYVAGSKDSSSVKDRMAGYKEALGEAGIPFQDKLVLQPKKGYGQMKDMINELVQAGVPVDGIITHSDMHASYILKGIKDGAVLLDEKVGIISFDGTYVAEITNPALTSITQPAYELGHSAVQLLLQKIQQQEINQSKRLIVEHRLVKRET
ncbi:LacI family DNA-binding transcriptional regulator [Paenibacillus sp. NPDC056579]|uniref:LacI family DNA-binding transcriptional regulator n=1 Tax=unclassified Paenibacillus TaxID=185978 RepID=UPI001EF79550|nr:LacI family DNA-binding transcriptional regulator [Paenibacillus sp. H1-7]